VSLSPDGEPKLNLPEGLDLKEAVQINKSAQRFDGIEDVVPGAVQSTDEARTAFHKILGMDLPTITPLNAAAISSEAVSRLNSKYNLGLSI
jgi:hypothetical protein